MEISSKICTNNKAFEENNRNDQTSIKEIFDLSPKTRDLVAEVKTAIAKFNLEQARLMRSKAVLKAIHNTVETENLSQDLRDKIIIALRLNCLTYESETGEPFNILGIDLDCEKSNSYLTLGEKVVLKSQVKTKLISMCADVEKLQDKINNGVLIRYVENTIGLNNLINDRKMNKLYQYCEFLSKLEECNRRYDVTENLLKQFMNCSFLNEGAVKYKDFIETSAEKLEIRAEIFEKKVMCAIISANNKTPEAATIIYNDLKQETEELTIELKRLQLNLSKYKQLEGTEYKSIVNEYLKVQKSIAHLNWLLKELS